MSGTEYSSVLHTQFFQKQRGRVINNLILYRYSRFSSSLNLKMHNTEFLASYEQLRTVNNHHTLRSIIQPYRLRKICSMHGCEWWKVVCCNRSTNPAHLITRLTQSRVNILLGIIFNPISWPLLFGIFLGDGLPSAI